VILVLGERGLRRTVVVRVLIGSFCGVWLGWAIPMVAMAAATRLEMTPGIEAPLVMVLAAYVGFFIAYMPLWLLALVGVELYPSFALCCAISFAWWWYVGTAYGGLWQLAVCVRQTRYPIQRRTAGGT